MIATKFGFTIDASGKGFDPKSGRQAGLDSRPEHIQEVCDASLKRLGLEVIDLRSLNPLDFDTVAESVRKTGRAVVMHEGPRTLGFGAELAARIQEELFYDLEAPVLRATGFDTPYPPARLEKLWLPGPDRLLDCVERAMVQP